MKFVFFSMRDFSQEGGGTIRMYGILNTLAAAGKDVVFVSNALNLTKFHSSIKHVNIGYKFNDKSRFQGLLGLLPARVIYNLYPRLFKNIKIAFDKVNIQTDKLIFFEYLDNSIAYVLKKSGKINGYINDLHGIATIEFKYQRDNAHSFKERTLFSLKYKLSDYLDRKVFNYADGFIYVSEAMKIYYEKIYKKIKTKKTYILPNTLGDDACMRKVDEFLKVQLFKQFKLNSNDFVFLFAGGYKSTAGVEDLIQVFAKLYQRYTHIKMILIGQGPSKNGSIDLVNKLDLNNQVVFIGNVPYEKLLTYQALSHTIVCPDRWNSYSELIVHLKYFDALISDRLVVNGSFSSVDEINKDQFLSLSFEPSNMESLLKTLEDCIIKYNELCQKYKDTKDYACKHLTYKSFIDVLYN